MNPISFFLTLFIICLVINIILFILYKNTYCYSEKAYKLPIIRFILFGLLTLCPIINAVTTVMLIMFYDFKYPYELKIKNKTLNKIIIFLKKDMFHE